MINLLTDLFLYFSQPPLPLKMEGLKWKNDNFFLMSPIFCFISPDTVFFISYGEK